MINSLNRRSRYALKKLVVRKMLAEFDMNLHEGPD
jgi:hypothetical protein